MHGARRDDPTEEGDEPPYPYAALHDDPGIAALRGHWQGQGWRPFSLPLGINLDQAHPVTSVCIKCKTCGGYPCLLKAKSDARTIAVESDAAGFTDFAITESQVRQLHDDGYRAACRFLETWDWQAYLDRYRLYPHGA